MNLNIFQEYFMREVKVSIVLSIGLVYFKAFFTALHMGHWNSTRQHQGALEQLHSNTTIAVFVRIQKEHVGLKAVTDPLLDNGS